MSDGVLFILLVLATYRGWRLLAADSLPPTTWLRERLERGVGARFGDVWAAGVACAWCSGFWVSCVAVGAVWHWRQLPLPGLWFGAVSTAVGLLAQRDEA